MSAYDEDMSPARRARLAAVQRLISKPFSARFVCRLTSREFTFTHAPKKKPRARPIK